MRRAASALIGGGLAFIAACTQAASDVPARIPPETTRPAPQAADDPLLRPISPDHAARWLGPQEPLRVHGNTYLVGFEGLTVAVIRTDDGLILVDGAVPQAVPAVEANLRALGFRIEDVKFILSTEPHWDHAGGLAALARDSGATVVASPEAAEVLARGRSGPDDPQAAWLDPFPAVGRLRPLRDGETLRLGGVTVTARATPGHTPGSMSWTWRSCEGEDCRTMVFASSLNPIAAEGYRFSDPAHRPLLEGFRRTLESFRTMPCDILLSAHPDQSGLDERVKTFRSRRSPNPFVEPSACRTYAERHAALLERRLERERIGEAR
jgi:metallo-beta-lactamase class B